MRRAVLEVADAQGTLPDEHNTELERLRKTVELPAPPKETDLQNRVDRLERVVVDQLGGQL